MALSLYTIAPDAPFVDVLAKALLDRADWDPFVLSRMRVLLPTRRAVGSLQEAFLRCSGGKPLLLPDMQPLGDVDEEALFFAGGSALDIPPAMAQTERVLRMAGLIIRVKPYLRMDQSIRLAHELARFLDEIAREQRHADDLKHLVPAELAEHWQITLRFLQIVLEHWPHILQETGRMDRVSHRAALLAMQAEHWQRHPPDDPVIAAGSTGSILATANLLDVIARLPQGMVILPALDKEMDEDSWEALEESHPQFGMKKLLERMNCVRKDVQDLAAIPASPRVSWLQEALRPAMTSDAWREMKMDVNAALRGIFRLDAATIEEEANAIALMMREALETPNKTVALITPNRALARRVCNVLQRFSVKVDDSAGVPLGEVPGGVWLRLIADVAVSGIAPVPLLSLLKHPLSQMGLPVGAVRGLAREIERAALRGMRLPPGFPPLKAALHQKPKLMAFVETLEAVFSPLMGLLGTEYVDVAALLAAHVQVAQALSQDESGIAQVWRADSGDKLREFAAEMVEHTPHLPPVDPLNYAGIFAALLLGKVYRARYGTHPRLHILGPMDARLLQFDLVILAGLNEGTWPEDARGDPWMSRSMRQDFALPTPERSIGLSAHDFVTLAASPQVVLTRAEKEGGTETQTARWLLRMEAVLGIACGKEAVSRWRNSGEKWLGWAQSLDKVAASTPCTPPNPQPPITARPREIAVTRMEMLMRNPYGFYAAQILKLRALDPLDSEPNRAEFGNLVHKAIEAFLKKGGTEKQELLIEGETVFGDLLERPTLKTVWWARFERIAQWLIAEMQHRKPHIVSVDVEKVFSTQWDAPAGLFTLKAKLDRLEHWHDGALRVIDYKTGALPTNSDIERGISCQLPLTGAILQAGGKKVLELEYWALKGKEGSDGVTLLADVAELMARTLEQVKTLVAVYDNETKAYPHCPQAEFAPKYNDYEHLARAKEWGGVVVKGADA